MSEEQLVIGDVVELKSGGQQMTVNAYSGMQIVHCIYHNKERNEFIEVKNINREALKKIR